MKQIKFLALIISLFLGAQAIAKVSEVMAPVGNSSDAVQTKRELMNNSENSVEKVIDGSAENVDTKIEEEVKSKLTNDMIKDLRACKPHDEKYDFELMGLNLSFSIKINGWVDKKCEYNMSAKVNNISDDFKNLFGLNWDKNKVSKIEPKVACAFTKKQLNLLVDAVVEEDKRNVDQINKLLNDPDSVYELASANELTPKEKELMDLLAQGEVCTVVNLDELIKQFSELMQPQSDK